MTGGSSTKASYTPSPDTIIGYIKGRERMLRTFTNQYKWTTTGINSYKNTINATKEVTKKNAMREALENMEKTIEENKTELGNLKEALKQVN